MSVQTEPFGYSVVGKWQKGDIVRFSITHLAKVPVNPNTLYFCTPHTFCSQEQLLAVKTTLVDKGCQVLVESLWTGFTKHCASVGFSCIPSYYELGYGLSFPPLKPASYPVHFGRSVLYESVSIKGFELLELFLAERFQKTKQKALVTAGRIQAPIAQLVAGKPWLEIHTHHPSRWIADALTKVGCNITATETDAGPRLFTYSARLGIGTVFFRNRLNIRMGEPIALLKPYAYIVESDSYDNIEAKIQEALKARGQKILSKEEVLQALHTDLTSYGCQCTFS